MEKTEMEKIEKRIREELSKSEDRVAFLINRVDRSGQRAFPGNIRDELLYEMGRNKGLRLAANLLSINIKASKKEETDNADTEEA